MDKNKISILLQKDLSQTSSILTEFLSKSTSAFSFPELSENNNRFLVWNVLFEHLQNSEATAIHAICLTTIKVLSRDKIDLDKLLCEKWTNILIERAGLHHLAAYDEESVPTPSFPQKDITMEGLKCIYNLALNSEKARGLFAISCLLKGLICRLRLYCDLANRNEIILFDIKILFILTAMREDCKRLAREMHASEYLVNCLKDLITEAGKNSKQDVEIYLEDEEQAVVCEILKVLFNLMSSPTNTISEQNETDESVILQIIPLLHTLLLAKTSNKEKLYDLRTNIANFIFSIPEDKYYMLSPPITEGDSQYQYEGHNMDAIQALLDLLHHKLIQFEEQKTQADSLCAILTVMYKLSASCRVQRKFLRQSTLPPLTDVSRPPEEGDALRNRLCRLLTSPHAHVTNVAAHFLFVLCKERVSRMVKYTGFGNAAGLLAQKGLLAGGRGADYSSSSDDSDTEEYRAARPSLDPVVGCTRPPRANPLEGMSEEQKEYEAMKLVNMLDKLQSSGVIKPARIGEDGKLVEVDHVLQLQDANDQP